jgi:hypothetical protein
VPEMTTMTAKWWRCFAGWSAAFRIIRLTSVFHYLCLCPRLLDELAAAVTPGAHAVVILDRAGWHTAKELTIPANLTPVYLPPYSPELNAVERVWLYLRERFLYLTEGRGQSRTYSKG